MKCYHGASKVTIHEKAKKKKGAKMVYLKLFKATKSIGKNIEVMEFESLEAAVRIVSH